MDLNLKLKFKDIFFIAPLLFIVCAYSYLTFMPRTKGTKITVQEGAYKENSLELKKTGEYYQVMFTDAQIELMVSRVTNGFSRPGTNGEDITTMVNEAVEFLKDPYAGRLDWMPSTSLKSCHRGCDPVPTNIYNRNHKVDDNIFYAGIYAYILANRNEEGDDEYAKQLANAIASQTLLRATDSSLDFSNRNSWLDGTELNPFFLTMAWLEKIMNNWSLIKSKNLVTNLTEAEEIKIENWFKNGRDWAYDKLSNHYVAAFGSNWRKNPKSTGYNKVYQGANNPVFAVNGVEQTDYTINHGAVLPTWNTASKYASFIHYYGLLYQDQNALDLSERWFHDVFILSVFSDGTSTELKRAHAGDPSLGLHYWSVTMSSLTSIAHSHAVAVLQGNPIVKDYSFSYFYDYTTSEGLSDYLSSHKGSDTKGGDKGLESYLVAFCKYLGQSTGLNQWGEIRQVNHTGNDIHQLTTNFPYIVPLAQANAYYNNVTLKNAYSGLGGYQTPLTKSEGASFVSAWRESYMGSFGKFMVAFPYLETEGIYE